MNISKTEIGMIFFIVIGAILIAWGIHTVTTVIEQEGLKSIINDIWCGEKGCD